MSESDAGDVDPEVVIEFSDLKGDVSLGVAMSVECCETDAKGVL